MKTQKLLLLLTIARITDSFEFLLSESKTLLSEEEEDDKNSLTLFRSRYDMVLRAAKNAVIESGDYIERNRIFIAWASMFEEELLQLFSAKDFSRLTTDLLWHVTKGKRIVSPVTYDIFNIAPLVLNEIFSLTSETDRNGDVYYPLLTHDNVFSFPDYCNTKGKTFHAWAKSIGLRKYTEDIYRYEIGDKLETFVTQSSVIRAYFDS